MSKHQIEVPDEVWTWARKQTGRTNPASFLRDLLWSALIQNVSAKTNKERWAAIDLEPDDLDPQYMAFRDDFIRMCGSEYAALEKAEKYYVNGYDRDEYGRPCVNNMRGYLIHIVRRAT